MSRKATIKVRPGIDDAIEAKEYKEVARLLEKSFLEQTERALTGVLKKVEERLGLKSEKAESGEEDKTELTDFQKKVIRQAAEEETESLDEFIDALVMFGFYVWSFNIGGGNFLRSKKIPLKFDLRNDHILRAMQGKVDLLIADLDETTKNFIAEKIIEGVESGLTRKQVADSIRDILPETYARRAETVAYTEMSNMVNAAETEAAVRNGAFEKRWITVGDDLVDPECEANEDEGMINVHDSFQSGHTRPPAHPNCRCILEFESLDLGYFWDGG
ncbi:MAG TPA: phage minor head protein [Candidatus Paceibacterota bacterium]